MEIENKLLLSRLGDVIERCQCRYSQCYLGFLSPSERMTIERKLPKLSDIHNTFWGGHNEAERTMFVCYPDYAEFEPNEVPIVCLEIRSREIERLNHRDFLGSVLALGIKREKIGDILPGGDKCLMFVSTDIAEYIVDNLMKIGNAGISVGYADIDTVELPERATDEINGTVANARIDAVLSVALKVSRSKASEYITSENVQVNWENVASVTRKMSENDIFSVKGFGRFRLKTIGHQSKKGRYHITIEKYL